MTWVVRLYKYRRETKIPVLTRKLPTKRKRLTESVKQPEKKHTEREAKKKKKKREITQFH